LKGNGDIKTLDIPKKYLKEMLADFRAMSRYSDSLNASEWYRRQAVFMNYNSEKWLSEQIEQDQDMSNIGEI